MQFLPILLFSPIAGVLADRFPKRRVLAVTQVAMGARPASSELLAITGWVTVWHVYVIAFLFGIGTAIDTPARQAFVHEMVRRDQLPNAVGLNSASFNLGRVIGPAIAGGLIAVLGSGVGATGWVIMLNAASYFAVIVSLVRMRPEELFTTPLVPRARGQLRDGIRYVRGRPDIMLVMAVVFCAGTFGLNFQMTTALMATQVYGKGAGEYGVLGSVHRDRFARRLVDGGQASGVAPAPRHRRRRGVRARRHDRRADAVVPDVRRCSCRCAVSPRSTLVTSANSFVQLAADPHMRGRVMALYMAIFMGGTPVGAPDARLGRRALRGPVDADRRWRADRDRHDHRSHHVRPAPERRRSRRACAPVPTSPSARERSRSSPRRSPRSCRTRRATICAASAEPPK